MNVKFPKYPVVRVTWEDSFTKRGWDMPEEYIQERGMYCCSVGFLFSRSQHILTIVQSCDEQGKLGESINIPVPAIKKVQYLTWGK